MREKRSERVMARKKGRGGRKTDGAGEKGRKNERHGKERKEENYRKERMREMTVCLASPPSLGLVLVQG